MQEFYGGITQNRIYSSKLVRALNKDYFELIRLPYLKISPWKHGLMTFLLFFLCMVSQSIVTLASIQQDKINKGESIENYCVSCYKYSVFFQVVLTGLGCFIVPSLVYCIPGYLYYKAILYYDLSESH
mmetsp:Transcript_38579/g.36930  ORF Transcript_38579/g.36930 Transcript_38579/m.36930 type:complete len:128 (-) Transcript_38579:166-549(-)